MRKTSSHPLDSPTFFATCPKGIEEILYNELVGLGALEAKQTLAGVHFKGGLETAYRVCLWSRLANRVLLALAHFPAQSPDELYAQVRSLIKWHDHMDVNGLLAVDFAASRSNKFHSHYAALRIKDAIVDQFNERFGARPSIDTERPDIRVNVYMRHNQATLYLDLSGDSLHKRGYRLDGGEAPLKENLAAAILIRAGWPDFLQKRKTLIDPMCGSGTLLLEAAMMAFDMAPGLDREYFGFLKWKGHHQTSWQRLLREAMVKKKKGLKNKRPLFFGFDADEKIIKQAGANASRAGLSGYIQFHCQDLKALKPPKAAGAGLIIANPPYGKRMGKMEALNRLYQVLGERLKENFSGWHASIFTANPDSAKQMGIRSNKQYKLFNGPLPCRLLNFEVHESWYMNERSPGRVLSEQKEKFVPDPGTEMFANRLKKNMKNIGKWARKQGITCFRLYDADMPEYAVAIDMYNDWVHVQEYQAPAGVVPENAGRRLKQIMSILPEVLKIPPENIVLKVRKKKKGKEQYEKMGTSGRFFETEENGLRFLVNLTDYLDTGLFIDQRNTRQLLRGYAAGKRVLNLFSYTGTATVYAAAGGAMRTTSVDMSNTYILWAEKNLRLNGFNNSRHKLIQADCLKWIKSCKEVYDLIFLDPPTFSNSKRMKDFFDIQRDHVGLLRSVLRLLAPGGLLIFSNNSRRFKADIKALQGWDVKDITRMTIPKDFQRNKRIHHCFEIRRHF
ncbi:MAG: bifunctional 23S rRNA (guanine(2069)-N(7))-methyltransferase RlmK/23S rRNA (guanine(2445)-N(2))-methyltransferase RlmL [Desulfobacterales bacterium]|nr:bifunctional 23S rRNA (guanine(2069)-N(7))-methyltransferase RlmK/23S rRNA (guanine(2445)-N(2))-methyltransferase RlmL [Desulfobacterales bacterium]